MREQESRLVGNIVLDTQKRVLFNDPSQNTRSDRVLYTSCCLLGEDDFMTKDRVAQYSKYTRISGGHHRPFLNLPSGEYIVTIDLVSSN